VKKIFSFVLFFVILFSCSFVFVHAEDNTYSYGVATYKELEVTSTNDLGYGIMQYQIEAMSSSTLTGFNAAGSGGGGLNESGKLYPQDVNIMTIPSNPNIRIVNWVNQIPDGWARGTVEQMAKNFESYNPGWKVIGAINGDFFDINGNNPLPSTANGTIIINGDVIKNIGGTNLGFTNDGSNKPIVGGKKIEVTTNYYVSIYNDNDEIINEFIIDSVNTEYSSGTVLYCSYPYFESDIVAWTDVVLPSGSYYVENPIRCIPFASTNGNQSFFGKGFVKVTEDNLTFKGYKFGIKTDNKELDNLLKQNPKVRIQKNVIGDYKDCDNMTGCGVELVSDGTPVEFNDKNRHPRTMVGVRSDGTLVFAIVDGRHPENDQYGMTYDEQAALMAYYGCVYAYNLDGGGSSTMLIRDNDKFKIMNTPSDGSPRRDANCLLVVVPEISLNVSNVTDTSLTISEPTNYKGMIIDNIKVTINNKEYSLKEKLTIDNLKANTQYEITFTYDRTYNGKTSKVIGDSLIITTGNPIPKINNLSYQLKDNSLIINYNITDTSSISSALVYYTGGSKPLDLTTNQITIPNVSSVNESDLKVVLFIDINSSTTTTIVKTYDNFNEIKEEVKETKKSGCGKASMVVLSMITLFGTLYVIRKKK